jgi:hypothetical protein
MIQELKLALEPVAIEHCLWARNGNTPCPHTSPPQRKPLTVERVQGLVGDAAVLIGREFETDFFSAATKLVRTTEAAHNIKE